jgi:hypothetical protein
VRQIERKKRQAARQTGMRKERETETGVRNRKIKIEKQKG